MQELNIKLDTVNDVKNFVNKLMSFESDVDLVTDRYIVDAKSILAIFSIDLSQALKLRISTDDEKEIAEIKNSIAEFIC